MKFKLAVFKNKKYLIKMVLDDGQEKWGSTSQAVFNFAKANFKEGDDADFVYKVENNQYLIDRINKPGYVGKTQQSNVSPTPDSQPSPAHVCEDCGVTLKDGKYKKCYNCNQKKPTPTYSGDYMKPRTPEEAERMTRLSILSSVCEAIGIMTGQVGDIGTLWEQIETLYDEAYKKITS
jgi:hypothetical protein